jgi:hypothetical protein
MSNQRTFMLNALKSHEKDAILFLLRHLGFGTLGALVFGGTIVYTDLGGILTLARADEMGWLYIALLFFGLFVTCGSIGMGVGIMSVSDGREDQPPH